MSGDTKRARAWLAKYRERGGTGREELVTPEQIEAAYGVECILCGQPWQELGHLVSVANGGDHTLDNLRPMCAGCNRTAGKRNIVLPEVEDTAHEVTGEDVADAALAYLREYTSLDDQAARVCVLYGMATWVAESFVYFPRLVINSTVHGVGKSVASKTVGALAANEKDCDAGAPTPAALRRMLSRRDERRPTFLVDELQKTDSEFRAVVNAGFERDAVIPITVETKNGWEVDEVPAYCAVVLTGISTMLRRDTLSRSIKLDVQPRGHQESANPEEQKLGLRRLRGMAQAWGAEQIEPRGYTRDGFAGRVASVVLPILKTGEMIGGKWEKYAEEWAAGYRDQAERDMAEPPISAHAVHGAHEYFEPRESIDFVRTPDLMWHLESSQPDRFGPRSGYDALTAKRIARMLGDWGASSAKESTPGSDGKRLRGYRRESISTALGRVIETFPSILGATSSPSSDPKVDMVDIVDITAELQRISDLPEAGHDRGHDGGRPAQCVVCGGRMLTYFDGQQTHPLCTPEDSAEHLATPSEVETWGLSPEDSQLIYGTPDYAHSY